MKHAMLKFFVIVVGIFFLMDMRAKEQLRGPDFLIIGTQKGGTTSLYRYLTKHPHIRWAVCKEVHFFDRHYRKGMDWYQAQFPEKGRNNNFLTGEATPAYIFHPLGAQRISKAYPDVKLILVLRNPVERTFSHYKMYVRKGLEDRSFEQALEQEHEMVKREKAKIVASGDKGYWSKEYSNFSYASRGMYLDQIKLFMKHFDKNQLLVVTSEDLMNNTEETINKVLRFLGLEEMTLSHYGYYHVAYNSQVVISPDTRTKLAALFGPKNKALQYYLTQELGQDIELNWD